MNSDGLSEFLAVSRAGTFTGAASVLNVSVAHVSRQVGRLEARLGTKLFQRSTRSVRLTTAGEQLRKSSEKISDDLERAFQEVSNTQRKLEGRLRIASMSGSFADQVVGPALNQMAAQHPGIEIEVDFNPRQVDILSEGYDFAIRAGPMQSSGLIAKPLSSRTRVAAVSPDYLKAHGVPRHPRDLKDHQCLLTNARFWRFSENKKQLDVMVHGRLSLNAGPAILDACMRDLGVAYMALAGFGDAFATGAVVPVLQNFWHRDRSIHLVRPDRRFSPRRVDVAISHLETIAKKVEAKERAELEAIRSH